MADALARSAAAVSIAPLGAPVVPDVDTTSATSSSIASPTRKAVVSKAVSRESGTPAPAAPRRDAAEQHPLDGRQQLQNVASRREPRAARRVAIRRPRCRVDRRAASPWRPAVAAPARRPSGDGSSSVIWVIATPMSMWSKSPRFISLRGDRLHLVGGEPARQQREHRQVVGRRHALGVARAQPRHDRREESVHCVTSRHGPQASPVPAHLNGSAAAWHCTVSPAPCDKPQTQDEQSVNSFAGQAKTA